MLLAPPVLHDEAEFVGVEKQPLRVARSRRSQVDQENDWELETLRGVDREQRDGVGTGCLLRRLADRKLRVDDLIEVADEVADSRERDVALESPGELEHLAQVEEGARAAVALRAQLGPAQVATLFEQAVEDVGNGERVAQQADAVGKLD